MQSHTILGHTNLLLDYMYGHCLSCSNDDHDCRAIACTGAHSVQDMTCTCMYLLISAICPCSTMAFITSLQLSGLGRHQVANIRPFSSSQQPVRRACVKHACTCSASEAPRALDRRETLLSLAAVATALNVNQAEAEGGELLLCMSPGMHHSLTATNVTLHRDENTVWKGLSTH